MNPRAYKQFLALADSLHFGRAAEACHVSISALSRTIRQLEDELDVLLFSRDNRTVALTDAGQTFLRYARDATAQWDTIRHELTDQHTGLNGKVRVYCSVTAAYSILFEHLTTLRAEHPGIEITLHTGDPEHAIARVIAGEDDISIAAHPDKLPRSVVFQPITITPLVFIAPIEPGQPGVPAGTPMDSDEWSRVPMILSETGIARNRTDAWFRQRGISIHRYAEVEGYEAIVSMVALGLGVGVIPKIVLDYSPMADRIRVLDASPALEPFRIGLFALKRNLQNPLVEAFWSLQQDTELDN